MRRVSYVRVDTPAAAADHKNTPRKGENEIEHSTDRKNNDNNNNNIRNNDNRTDDDAVSAAIDDILRINTLRIHTSSSQWWHFRQPVRTSIIPAGTIILPVHLNIYESNSAPTRGVFSLYKKEPRWKYQPTSSDRAMSKYHNRYDTRTVLVLVDREHSTVS